MLPPFGVRSRFVGEWPGREVGPTKRDLTLIAGRGERGDLTPEPSFTTLFHGVRSPFVGLMAVPRSRLRASGASGSGLSFVGLWSGREVGPTPFGVRSRFVGEWPDHEVRPTKRDLHRRPRRKWRPDPRTQFHGVRSLFCWLVVGSRSGTNEKRPDPRQTDPIAGVMREEET